MSQRKPTCIETGVVILVLLFLVVVVLPRVGTLILPAHMETGRVVTEGGQVTSYSNGAYIYISLEDDKQVAVPATGDVPKLGTTVKVKVVRCLGFARGVALVKDL